MKTRRIFGAIITGALALALAGVMVACSSSSTTTTTSDTSTTEETHDAVTLEIFAANSLQKAMPEVMAAYQVDHSWVTFSDAQYLSSGDLVTKLQNGATADILITASKSTMDQAASSDLIETSSRFDMFTNDLVVVASSDSDITIDSLSDILNYSLCIGDESVPAGNYAREALASIGAYTGGTSGKGGTYEGIDPLLDTSVGNVCQHAASGDVDLAIVYSSDVYRYSGVKVVYEIPASTHDTIVYPAAVCSSSTNQEAATDFLEWATTDPEAIAIWQEWGFSLA
jgi:molybdate transport system substrate-binding protein